MIWKTKKEQRGREAGSRRRDVYARLTHAVFTAETNATL